MQVNKVENSDFVDNYIKPAASSLMHMTYLVVVETVKIVAAKMFLEFLSQRYLSHSSELMPEEIYQIVILAPLVEEILFRLFLLRGIHLIQCGVNRLYDDDLSAEEEQEKAQFQQISRVHVTAFIFAAAHLTNPHTSRAGAITQFVWSYLGGVTYGYLSEKYHSLAPAILAHGFNNSLVVAAGIYPDFAPHLVLAVLSNRLASYLLGATSIDHAIAGRAHDFYFSVSDRITHSHQGDAVVI